MLIFFEDPQETCFLSDFDKIWHVSFLAPEKTIEYDFLKIGPLQAEVEEGGETRPSRRNSRDRRLG